MRLEQNSIRANFQLTLIIMVGVLAVIFIAPFAVLRFLEGNYIVAAADAIMVLVAGGCAGWTWKTGAVELPGLIMAALLSLGAAFVTLFIGLEGALWVYPLIMFVFFLAPPKLAMLIILSLIAAVTMRELQYEASVFPSRIALASFITSTLTAAIFNFFFATRNKRHHSVLRHLADHDPLTGTGNRRGMELALSAAVSARNHLQVNSSLILIDIDHFKEINDEWGHAEGDAILKRLSNLIQKTIRSSDHVYRFGGDEFVVLLSYADHEGTIAVMQNLLEAVRENLECNSDTLTVSLGSAVLQDGETPLHWFKRADERLYKAKQSGRNRAVHQ